MSTTSSNEQFDLKGGEAAIAALPRLPVYRQRGRAGQNVLPRFCGGLAGGATGGNNDAICLHISSRLCGISRSQVQHFMGIFWCGFDP